MHCRVPACSALGMPGAVSQGSSALQRSGDAVVDRPPPLRLHLTRSHFPFSPQVSAVHGRRAGEAYEAMRGSLFHSQLMFLLSLRCGWVGVVACLAVSSEGRPWA
jgi:hypothetical protein